MDDQPVEGNEERAPSSESGESLPVAKKEDALSRFTKVAITVLGILLCFYTLGEVNYNTLRPLSGKAGFILIGMALCFLVYPVHPRLKDNKAARWIDLVLAGLTVVCCGYVIVQTQPLFESFWSGGQTIENRAGSETQLDFVIGCIGLLLVLESTRRSIGWIVPALALVFVGHSYYCFASIEYGLPELPDWLLPQSGQSLKVIVAKTFFHSGVFSEAAKVMFKYVFLFVVFGAFLEMSGATQFIIDFATKTFGRIQGGPAMVSVLASGLMGSLSGSAVANAVTTGSFTIPMMRSARFPKHIAGGITAAAASGGALVPPVMGAGAYMILEIVQPDGGFVTIMKAAIIPAALYYLSLLAIVFFYSRRLGTEALDSGQVKQRRLSAFEGGVFFGALFVLIGLLFLGFSPFRSVSGALAVILVCATLRKELQIGRSARLLALASFSAVLVLHQLTAGIDPQGVSEFLRPFLAPDWIDPRTDAVSAVLFIESILSSAIVGMFGLLIFGLVHPAWRPGMVKSLTRSAKNGISLVAASACVGIVIAIVTTTGVAGDFSSEIKALVETNLLYALLGIMACSIVLGMGVPSVVCYLLMAYLMGTLLDQLGVIPLAAHLFIFYFGMMSMVTPPVALAAYASASIAEARIMQTAMAAFRFSLVGFTLPFMFVYRPELLMLSNSAEGPAWSLVVLQTLAAAIGIVALASGLAGYFRGQLGIVMRVLMFVAAVLLLYPGREGIAAGSSTLYYSDMAGLVLFAIVAAIPGGGTSDEVPAPDAAAA